MYKLELSWNEMDAKKINKKNKKNHHQPGHENAKIIEKKMYKRKTNE